ncbi:MAG: protein translocase subunit SecD [Actinomycetota bacterium]|nr:protein translocase subunit SecD [Actinomycetota bacterium]
MKDRRNHLIVLGCILAALVGVAFLAAPGSPAYKKPTLGLDLQGGLEVVLKAVPPKHHKLTSDDISRSIDIMRQRIDKLGVSEPEIRKQGTDQIVIQLAGVHDPAAAAKLIGKTAVLEFYDFEADLTGPSVSGLTARVPVASASLFDLLSAPQTRALADKGTPSQWYLFDSKNVVRAGPTPTKQVLLATQVVQKPVAKNGLGKHIPKDWSILKVPKNTVVVSCDAASGNCLSAQQITSKTGFYLLRHREADKNGQNAIPEMTGGDLKLSGTRADFDTQTNSPVVLMQFTGKGKKIFHTITRREAQRGALICQGRTDSTSVQNCVQHFAIVLDGQIQSAPYIDFVRNPDGIPGDNGAQIDMGRSGGIGDAKRLALVLQTGALPVTFDTAERTDVSATLGKDSLSQAKKAALVGLLVVALFLLLLYRFLGLVAVIGLGIYAAFLYAAILLFNVTLTLPGFAGLILTIGVAADANVVVFERIKEEVRAGKFVRAAISAGYSKGFHTILDANVVTAITALVLFAVATAQVKGFALMLLIGTVISLVTAVGATRAMLGLLAGFSWFNKPRFMGAQGQQTARWLQIDFMRKRYVWFAMSGAILVLGIGALGIRGLNLGIDFKGGTQLSFKTPAAHTTGDVRQIMGDQGYNDAVIQGRGASTNSEYKSFQVRTKALSSDKLTQVTRELEDKLQATAPGATTVSSSFGRQIAKSAIIAVVFSLFLVVLYIAIRFDLKFAGPVIAAMLHDVLICIGIYALLGREVTSSTVAAILTVLGYSIYDTIIIFDRVRENIPIMRRSSIATIVNVSLWETIRRSLATSFITLLPVGALFLYGGATLKDFAFALMVGIASGAYSSIFIAAPLLTILKEREPEYVRRKGETLSKSGMDAVLDEAEEEAADEPAPELVPIPTLDGPAAAAAAAKRERRRQRRRARPHGRAR